MHLHEVHVQRDSHITEPDQRQTSGPASGSCSRERTCVVGWSVMFSLSLPYSLFLAHGDKDVFVGDWCQGNRKGSGDSSVFSVKTICPRTDFLFFFALLTTQQLTTQLCLHDLHDKMCFCWSVLCWFTYKIWNFFPQLLASSTEIPRPTPWILHVLSTSCPSCQLGSLFLDLLYSANSCNAITSNGVSLSLSLLQSDMRSFRFLI